MTFIQEWVQVFSVETSSDSIDDSLGGELSGAFYGPNASEVAASYVIVGGGN